MCNQQYSGTILAEWFAIFLTYNFMCLFPIIIDNHLLNEIKIAGLSQMLVKEESRAIMIAGVYEYSCHKMCFYMYVVYLVYLHVLWMELWRLKDSSRKTIFFTCFTQVRQLHAKIKLTVGCCSFPVIVNKTLFVYLAFFGKMFASVAGI